MIQDTQEYLQKWEKENNPFYPSEMRWTRLTVNNFLNDYKQQLNLPVVSNNEVELCEKNYVIGFGNCLECDLVNKCIDRKEY